jgi:hypothetical protein
LGRLDFDSQSRAGAGKPLFSWWQNIGLQTRFMVIASVGLLTLAIGALTVVDWYEFSGFEEKVNNHRLKAVASGSGWKPD